METHTYPHFPADVSTVHIALFSNVRNADELRNRLVAVSNSPQEENEHEREALSYAFIDAKLVTSRLQMRTAIYQAILAYVQGSMRTKTVHSEVLWCLNPTHNISEAFSRFGVSDTTTSLVVVKVSSQAVTPPEFEASVQLAVKGVLTPLTSLEQYTNWDLVRKFYKLNAATHTTAPRKTQDGGDFSAREKLLMDQIVISSIALKSVSG